MDKTKTPVRETSVPASLQHKHLQDLSTKGKTTVSGRTISLQSPTPNTRQAIQECLKKQDVNAILVTQRGYVCTYQLPNGAQLECHTGQ